MAVNKSKAPMKRGKTNKRIGPNVKLTMSAKDAEFFMSGKKKKYKQGK